MTTKKNNEPKKKGRCSNKHSVGFWAHLKKWQKVLTVIVSIITIISASYAVGFSIIVWQNEGQIKNIIQNEAIYVIEKNPDKAVSLYAENAVVKDAAGGNANLVVAWMGINQIKERYLGFQNYTFTFLVHGDVHVVIDLYQNRASATADTTGQYLLNGEQKQITSNQGEKWTFEKVNGIWKIDSFTYNLP